MPATPTITNANCHCPCNKAQTTSGGASSAPMDEPMLNQPIATERSLAGNHSLVAFTPAGMPPASAMPSTPRKNARLLQPVDHAPAAQAQYQDVGKRAKHVFDPPVSRT